MPLANHLIIALVASDLDKIPVKLVVKNCLDDMLKFLEHEVHPSEHLLDAVIIRNSVLNKTSLYTLAEFLNYYQASSR